MPITRHGYEPPKQKTVERGYGHPHRKLRKLVRTRVELGLEKCKRCGHPIHPNEPWDLDHTDNRTGYLGASHQACNRAAPHTPRPPHDE